MQRREFLFTSVVSVVGFWGCGGSTSDSGTAASFVSPSVQSEAVFSSDREVEVEANINARGEIIYSERSLSGAAKSGGSRVGRIRAGSSNSEVLVQSEAPESSEFCNPRIDTSGDSVSWLESKDGQSRIVALIGGLPVGPWLPPAGYQFVQNLGIDGENRLLYAIADDAQGNSVLLRGDQAVGTTTAYQFPFSGSLRMRMERSCRYAVGRCSLGAIAFSNEGPVPSFQVLSRGTPFSYSVNAAGGIGVLESDGGFRYFTREPSTATAQAPPGGQPITVSPGSGLSNLYGAQAQAIREALRNSSNQQPPGTVGNGQGSTPMGVSILYGIDTAPTGVGTLPILSGLVLITPAQVVPGDFLYTQQPGQVAGELDIQREQGCVALNNPAQILRLRLTDA